MIGSHNDTARQRVANSHLFQEIETSIVLPRYKESFDIIDRTIEKIRRIQRHHSLQIIVVNDSESNSFYDEDIRKLRHAHPDVIVISNAENRGKGYSVRRGVDLASGKYIVYSDIDFPVSEEDFYAAHRHIKDGNFDMVIGNRNARGRVKANYYRAVTSKLFRGLVNVLFDKDIADTQCPFKILTADTAKELFSKQFVNGYAFDAEVIYLSRLLSKSLFQLPVNWEDTRENWSLLKTISNYSVMVSDLIRVKVYWDIKAGARQGGASNPRSSMRTDSSTATATPSVSVIIPTRNRREYTLEALRLLSDQTHPAHDTEVIVVDDGSADGTREAIAGTRYPFRMVCHRIESAGEAFWAARPRNAGLRLATGSVVVLLDSDVFVNAGFLAAHVALHAARPAGSRPRVGIGDIFGTSLDNDERTAARLRPPSITELAELVRLERRPPPGWSEGRADYARAWPELATCPVPWLFLWTGNVSMSRELAVELGGFDEQFRGWGCEDNDLGYRLFHEGAEFSWLPAAWGVHYPHPISPTMEAEVRRNCLYLLSKFPEPFVEVVLWSVRLAHPLDLPSERSREGWRIGVVREIEQAQRAYAAEPPSIVPSELFAHVQATRVDPGRPVLWCGPLPSDHGTKPDVVHSNLLGLATPWHDDAFSAAVAVNYWTVLSPARLRAVLRELSRVASRVVMVATGSRSVPSALRDELELHVTSRGRVSVDSGAVWELVTQR
jgi:glycosyltransferase involved in cell wall biosynthesis